MPSSIDYSINAHFRLQNAKIVEQKDIFSSISQFKFAEMAFGFPLQFLALTRLLRIVVRKKAAEKLSQFMKEHVYYATGLRETGDWLMVASTALTSEIAQTPEVISSSIND